MWRRTKGASCRQRNDVCAEAARCERVEIDGALTDGVAEWPRQSCRGFPLATAIPDKIVGATMGAPRRFRRVNSALALPWERHRLSTGH